MEQEQFLQRDELAQAYQLGELQQEYTIPVGKEIVLGGDGLPRCHLLLHLCSLCLLGHDQGKYRYSHCYRVCQCIHRRGAVLLPRVACVRLHCWADLLAPEEKESSPLGADSQSRYVSWQSDAPGEQ